MYHLSYKTKQNELEKKKKKTSRGILRALIPSNQEQRTPITQIIVAHVIQRCILLGFAGAGAGVNRVRFSGMERRQRGI